MKKAFNILMIMAVVIIGGACSQSMRSYSEMLEDQQTIIDRWIDSKGFEVIKEYPKDGVFKPNQFMLFENGLYMNVIDSGNGKRPTLNKTTILARLNFEFTYLSDTMVNKGDNFHTGTWPIEFKFGSYSSMDNNSFNDFMGQGLAFPLEFVGENAVVQLIVPFSMANPYSTFAKSGVPVYHSKVRYTFEK